VGNEAKDDHSTDCLQLAGADRSRGLKHCRLHDDDDDDDDGDGDGGLE